MSGRLNRQKITSWVTPTFDDFDFDVKKEKNPRKRPRQEESHAQPRRRLQKEGTALWVDVYAPTSRDDLAVHKKKVQEVESWIVESMAGMKGRRFLLLTGPAGCGKSATVRLLAKEAGLTIQEWINPTTVPYKSYQNQENEWIPGDTVSSVSQAMQFRDFFVRASKYQSVCGQGRAGNLICIEDFPNAFLRDPSEFHAILRRYQLRGSSPVVFILTDSKHQQSSVKHLFPPDVQQDLSIINIAFNPIASGMLLKALTRVVNLENTCEGGSSQPLPTKESLQILADTSGGDVRSAVNSIQFASRKDVYHLEELFTSSSRKSKSLTRSRSRNKASSSKSLVSSKTNDESDGLAMVGGKDASLFLFRALGKVLYCKREQEKGIVDVLPQHLKLHERTPLQESPESIYEKASMGAASFGLFLHQNAPSFYSSIDNLSQALQHMTDADVLISEWTGKDVLEDYSALVTIRGLMHACRESSSGGGWRPFTRPQWYSTFKEAQHNSGALKYDYRLSSLTSEELTTVMVPLKAKIMSLGNTGQFTMTRAIGLFSNLKKRGTGERLDERDAESSIVEEEDLSIGVLGGGGETQTFVQLETNQEPDDPDEDFIIEEFADD